MRKLAVTSGLLAAACLLGGSIATSRSVERRAAGEVQPLSSVAVAASDGAAKAEAAERSQRADAVRPAVWRSYEWRSWPRSPWRPPSGSHSDFRGYDRYGPRYATPYRNRSFDNGYGYDNGYDRRWRGYSGRVAPSPYRWRNEQQQPYWRDNWRRSGQPSWRSDRRWVYSVPPRQPYRDRTRG